MPFGLCMQAAILLEVRVRKSGGPEGRTWRCSPLDALCLRQ